MIYKNVLYFYSAAALLATQSAVLATAIPCAVCLPVTRWYCVSNFSVPNMNCCDACAVVYGKRLVKGKQLLLLTQQTESS